MNTKEHLLNIVESAIPKDAKQNRIPSDDIKVLVFWYTHDIKNRSKKQSRNIVFIIPKEVIEDYTARLLTDRSNLDIKISSEINKVISQFNKQSNHRIEQSPPSETLVFNQITGYFMRG